MIASSLGFAQRGETRVCSIYSNPHTCLNLCRRTVKYECYGHSIPPWVEVDAKTLDVDQLVLVRDLPIPPGTRLVNQVIESHVWPCMHISHSLMGVMA